MLHEETPSDIHNVVIIGGGPAGLSAALYLSRASLQPILFAGSPAGGQLMLTTEVENFPGQKSIMGPDLIEKMREQVTTFGTTIYDKHVASIEKHDDIVTVVVNKTERIQTRSLIIATGAKALWLGLEKEQQLRGRGVSACATCDGFFFRDRVVGIVGGGDTALEEALTLTKFAKKVYVIHRRDQFRASKIMQERVLDHEKIEVIWNMSVKDLVGEQKLESVILQPTNQENGESKTIPLDGLFVAIGHKPDTDIIRDHVMCDDKGYVLTSSSVAYVVMNGASYDTKAFNFAYQSMTSIPGIFAAGDCVDHIYRQASTAAGMGVGAALDAQRYLEH